MVNKSHPFNARLTIWSAFEGAGPSRSSASSHGGAGGDTCRIAKRPGLEGAGRTIGLSMAGASFGIAFSRRMAQGCPCAAAPTLTTATAGKGSVGREEGSSAPLARTAAARHRVSDTKRIAPPRVLCHRRAVSFQLKMVVDQNGVSSKLEDTRHFQVRPCQYRGRLFPCATAKTTTLASSAQKTT